jgi:RNA polymerase sigma factor (sigma-70 family)
MSLPAASDVDVGEVLSLYAGRLIRHAHRILHDREEARDVVQDTLLRFWQQDPRQLAGRLPQWLFTVCRNRALDVRRRRARLLPLDPDAHAEPTSLAPLPCRVFQGREALRAVLEVFATLPASQQRVLALRLDDGLSYREIARTTGLTVSHVGVLVHEGLKTLRRRLARLSGLERQ